jgi:hypothetical protein
MLQLGACTTEQKVFVIGTHKEMMVDGSTMVLMGTATRFSPNQN